MPFKCSMLLTFSQGLLHLGSSQLCPDETLVSLERQTEEVSKSALLCGCHVFQHHYFQLDSKTSKTVIIINVHPFFSVLCCSSKFFLNLLKRKSSVPLQCTVGDTCSSSGLITAKAINPTMDKVIRWLAG